MQPQQCEACGQLIKGRSKTVRIEGSQPMTVCDRCARLGTEVQAPASPRPAPGKVSSGTSRQAPMPARRKRDVFDFIGGDIVEDYPERIREARLAKGMSQKDLALELKEKEHLIKKIENGDLIPEDAVRKKIEAALGIRLVEAEDTLDDTKSGGKTQTTLGDVISVKRK
ncbi:MAG: TIGR00270 family protein [Methanocalculus sp. MSAO_Arc1]|uniref:multiprotein bridging factor aMBF1 n=1 Tax=Methanocalculus TaxID=71151 RepID=UPI000FF59CFA|nr:MULTISPECIES: multiprotein bridging factor aMBF1 [unclassified Methanocalculus]MCP1661951.1 putative transcription factor [Methanocalculus sp. AMF5]RQD80536.1 MAG: TIGR00270 family protein [Methanocalculus sp. MSAO_Arc1]